MTALAQKITNTNYANPWLCNNYGLLADISDISYGLVEFEMEDVDSSLIRIVSIKNTAPLFQEAKWQKSLDYPIEKDISVEKWLALYMTFRDKFLEKADLFLNATADQVDADFKKSAERIFDLRPDVVSVEVTDDECVFIYAEFDNRHIFYNIFYDEDGREFQLNLIKDRKPIASISGDINSTLAELDNFIGGRFGDDNYAISEKPNTEIYI